MIESKDYLIDLIKKLIDREVNFIVCGGVAAVLHGVERLTMDLDVALDLTKENMDRFLSVMREARMIPRAPVPPESILDRTLLEKFVKEKGALVFTFLDPQFPFKQIDFFLTEDKSYSELIKETVEIKLDEGYSFRILSIPCLLRMKLAVKPPREKDLQDISALKKIQENMNVRPI
jgi:hypothetical protein